MTAHPLRQPQPSLSSDAGTTARAAIEPTGLKPHNVPTTLKAAGWRGTIGPIGSPNEPPRCSRLRPPPSGECLVVPATGGIRVSAQREQGPDPGALRLWTSSTLTENNTSNGRCTDTAQNTTRNRIRLARRRQPAAALISARNVIDDPPGSAPDKPLEAVDIGEVVESELQYRGRFGDLT